MCGHTLNSFLIKSRQVETIKLKKKKEKKTAASEYLYSICIKIVEVIFLRVNVVREFEMLARVQPSLERNNF